MLTLTSKNAIRAMIFLGCRAENGPFSPRFVASELGLSPTYTAKIFQMLTRANLLKAQRGVMGGVQLAAPAEQITVRAIVEACQGVLVGDYCQETKALRSTCAFHQAMAEVHQALTGVLERWTLADLVKKPCPNPQILNPETCTMCIPPASQ